MLLTLRSHRTKLSSASSFPPSWSIKSCPTPSFRLSTASNLYQLTRHTYHPCVRLSAIDKETYSCKSIDLWLPVLPSAWNRLSSLPFSKPFDNPSYIKLPPSPFDIQCKSTFYFTVQCAIQTYYTFVLSSTLSSIKSYLQSLLLKSRPHLYHQSYLLNLLKHHLLFHYLSFYSIKCSYTNHHLHQLTRNLRYLPLHGSMCNPTYYMLHHVSVG